MPPAPRPSRVNRALVLLWVALVVGCISVSASLPAFRDETNFVVFVVSGSLVLLLANAVLILLIGRRHDWARIVMLVVVLLSLFATLPFDLPSDALGILAATTDWFSRILELIAMYLLFTRDSPAWFRKHSGEAANAL